MTQSEQKKGNVMNRNGMNMFFFVSFFKNYGPRG